MIDITKKIIGILGKLISIRNYRPRTKRIYNTEISSDIELLLIDSETTRTRTSTVGTLTDLREVDLNDESDIERII